MESSAIDQQVKQPYKYGWSTDIESELAPKGLNEDIIRLISEKKEEPEYEPEKERDIEKHETPLTDVEVEVDVPVVETEVAAPP